MSVTLEQCVLLRERHTLSRQHFSTALDCMRRFVYILNLTTTLFLTSSSSPSSLPSSFVLISFPLIIFVLSSAFHLFLRLFPWFLFFFFFHHHVSFLFFLSPSLHHTHSSRSRLSLGQMLGCYAQSGFTVCGLEPGEPPSGVPLCLAPKAPRRHLYPVAFLLVTSHLLVVWLILSLVILMAKYQ